MQPACGLVAQKSTCRRDGRIHVVELTFFGSFRVLIALRPLPLPCLHGMSRGELLCFCCQVWLEACTYSQTERGKIVIKKCLNRSTRDARVCAACWSPAADMGCVIVASMVGAAKTAHLGLQKTLQVFALPDKLLLPVVALNAFPRSPLFFPSGSPLFTGSLARTQFWYQTTWLPDYCCVSLARVIPYRIRYVLLYVPKYPCKILIAYISLHTSL